MDINENVVMNKNYEWIYSFHDIYLLLFNGIVVGMGHDIVVEGDKGVVVDVGGFR